MAAGGAEWWKGLAQELQDDIEIDATSGEGSAHEAAGRTGGVA